MKLRNGVILILFAGLLIMGSVSASEDSLQNNLTVQTQDFDIQEMSISKDTQNPSHNDESVLGQAVDSDDNIQGKSSQDRGDVFESVMTGYSLANTDNEIEAAQDWKTFDVRL